MRINSFEDVLSWQKGKDLYIELTKDFHSSRDYDFNSQLFRATLSITNNIAEGFVRGSCAEVRSMLYIALEDKKISQDRQQELINLSNEISKLLTGFINKLETGGKRLRTNL